MVIEKQYKILKKTQLVCVNVRCCATLCVVVLCYAMHCYTVQRTSLAFFTIFVFLFSQIITIIRFVFGTESCVPICTLQETGASLFRRDSSWMKARHTGEVEMIGLYLDSILYDTI